MHADGVPASTSRVADAPVGSGSDVKECVAVDGPGHRSISNNSEDLLMRPLWKNVFSRHSSRNVSHSASSTRYRRRSFSRRPRRAMRRGIMESRVWLSKMAWESYCVGAGGCRKQARTLEVDA